MKKFLILIVIVVAVAVICYFLYKKYGKKAETPKDNTNNGTDNGNGKSPVNPPPPTYIPTAAQVKNIITNPTQLGINARQATTTTSTPVANTGGNMPSGLTDAQRRAFIIRQTQSQY